MSNGFTKDVAKVVTSEITTALKPISDQVQYISGKVDGLSGSKPKGSVIILKHIGEIAVYGAIFAILLFLVFLIIKGQFTVDTVERLLRAWGGG